MQHEQEAQGQTDYPEAGVNQESQDHRVHEENRVRVVHQAHREILVGKVNVAVPVPPDQQDHQDLQDQRELVESKEKEVERFSYNSNRHTMVQAKLNRNFLCCIVSLYTIV